MVTTDKAITELENRIEQMLADWTIPGAGVVAMKGGEPLLMRGFGVRDVESGAAVNADTAFAIGSCTKSFTAVAVGILVDDGLIGWDDPVIKHLPDFALYDDWITQHVTVRDILSHRVGLNRALMLYQKLDMPKAEIVRRMRFLDPRSSFRSDFCYGNSHYTLAGELIEAVSGQPWAQFVRERILAPLAMHQTYTSYDEMIAATDNYTQAHAHLGDRDSLLPQSIRMIGPQSVIDWQNIGAEAAGSIITTATDIVHWLNMLTKRGAPLLKPQTFEALRHPQIVPRNYLESEFAPFYMLQSPVNFYAYGLGFYLFDYRGHRVMVGGGQIQGMNAAFLVMPEQEIATAVMVNTFQTMGYLSLTLLLADALLGVDDRDWHADSLALAGQFEAQTMAQVQPMIDARQTDTAPSFSLSDYAGTYHSDLLGTVTVTAADDHLTLDYGTGYAGTLTHWQDDSFVFTMTAPTVVDKTLMQFTIEDGAVKGLQLRDGAQLVKQSSGT